MPQLQERHNDDDSSSDGLSMLSKNLDEQVLSSILILKAEDVILNIDQLTSISVYLVTAGTLFEKHLHDINNMELDDDTNFASATDFLDVLSDFFFSLIPLTVSFHLASKHRNSLLPPPLHQHLQIWSPLLLLTRMHQMLFW